jgi:hypothetical protein
MRNAYNILVGKPERKRSRRKWEDNIRVTIKELVLEGGTGFI